MCLVAYTSLIQILSDYEIRNSESKTLLINLKIDIQGVAFMASFIDKWLIPLKNHLRIEDAIEFECFLTRLFTILCKKSPITYND